jgi:cytochrome c oxidase assembly factor CtaG
MAAMSHPGGAVNGVTPPLFEAWTVDLWVAVPLGLAVVVYVRGWRRLHRRVPQRFGAGRLAAFVGGMVAIGAALESPLHALGA